MRTLLLALAFCCSPVFAFGELGHQMVCTMAYQLLSPVSQQKVQQLMELHSESDFSKSCSWPDQVRALPQYQHTKVWHYVNIERSETRLTMRHCPAQGCVLSAIEQQRKKLTPFAPSKEQLHALLYLSHFIADLHQPLHAGYADDLGGNKTAVYFAGEPSNLHSVWDSRLLEAGSYQHSSQQQALFQALKSKQQEWQQTGLLDWANESVMLVKLIYQSYKAGMLIDEGYQDQHLPQLEQRLQQAAVRLALVLEQHFNPATNDG